MLFRYSHKLQIQSVKQVIKTSGKIKRRNNNGDFVSPRFQASYAISVHWSWLEHTSTLMSSRSVKFLAR